MMLAAKQLSLAWVKGNTCLGRKNTEESWFLSQVPRFSFWDLIPQILRHPQDPAYWTTCFSIFLEQDKSASCSRTEPPPVHWKKSGFIFCYNNRRFTEAPKFPTSSHKPVVNITQSLLPQIKWMCEVTRLLKSNRTWSASACTCFQVLYLTCQILIGSNVCTMHDRLKITDWSNKSKKDTFWNI